MRSGWGVSLALYCIFAALVFAVLGGHPLLGPDHLTYFELADDLLASCPYGDYWRETTSVRSFGVLLAYMEGWTGSHVLSMKLVLALFTVLYLLGAELLFRLFTAISHARLFAILSAFAVSFGIASWGVTDSTALLPRTLVAPLIMFCVWFWFRFDGRAIRYLVFPFLVAGSLLHLSTFYVIGVLIVAEAWDFVIQRRLHIDRRVPAFVGGLALAGGLLFGLEYAGLSSKLIGVQIPDMLRSMGFNAHNIEMHPPGHCTRPATPPAPPPAVAPPPVAPAAVAAGSAPPTVTSQVPGQTAVKSAKEAWAIELSLRPWRNMPLPLVNVANALSSFGLILILALAGIVSARRGGFTRADHLMLGLFIATPIIAFGPQTALWILRSFTSIYPATIEEVRAVSLVMIPALYFILRLFDRALASGSGRAPLAAGAIALGVVALPLVMKNLPAWAREGILGAMTALHVVDPASAPAVANARSALGLSAAAAPLYYSTQGVRAWLATHTPPGARILTDRDDMILLRDRVIVGTRQLGAITYYATPEQTRLFLEMSRAIAARDERRVAELGRSYDAQWIVVPWRVVGAPYADDEFSVLAVEGPRA